MSGPAGNNGRPQEGKSRRASALDFFLIVPVLLSTSGAFYLLYTWHILPLTNYPLGFWQVFGLRLTLIVILNMLRLPKSPKTDVNQSIALILYSGAAILLGWWAKWMM